MTGAVYQPLAWGGRAGISAMVGGVKSSASSNLPDRLPVPRHILSIEADLVLTLGCDLGRRFGTPGRAVYAMPHRLKP